nr:MAG: maturation protein [Leviviridae sp.]
MANRVINQFRTKTLVRKGTAIVRRTDIPSCPPPTPITCTQNLSLNVSTFQKNWHQQSKNAAGFFPRTLPYTKIEVRSELEPVKVDLTQSALPCGTNQYLLEEPRSYVARTTFSPLYESLVNDAKTNLIDQVQDQKSMIAVSVLEAGKSLEMILLRAQQIARAIKQLKRGDIRGVLRNLGQPPKNFDRHRRINSNDIAGNWLEYRYGWMPLLMDAQGIAQQFADDFILGQDRSDYITQKVTRRNKFTDRTTGKAVAGAWCGNTQPYPSFQWVDTIDQQEEYKIWARFKLTNPKAKSLSEWGVINPLQTIWELVPLSFVAGWFCSLGDYISHLTAFTGLTLDDAGEGRMLQVDQRRIEKCSWAPSRNFIGYSSYSSYTRTPITNIAGLKPDYLRLHFTSYWKHWMDGMALLRVLTK